MAEPLTAAKYKEILRAEGVKTAEPYSDWPTHGRDSATGRTFGPAHGCVIHHTAGADSLKTVHDGTGDLPGPLCHGHLPKSAVLNLISVHRANHAGSFAQNAWDAMVNESHVHPAPDAAEPVDANDGTYGLEIENRGDGSDVYPKKQYVAAVKWATAICRHYGWSGDSVIGHKEGTRRKIDPKGPVEGGSAFTMNGFRADVDAALALPAGVWGTEEEDDVALTTADINKVADAVLAKLVGSDDLLEYIVKRDGVLKNPNPDTSTDNPEIAVGTALNNVEIVVRRVDAALAQLEVGGVDVNALGTQIASILAARLQS